LPTYTDVLEIAKGGGAGVFESECGGCHGDVNEADMRDMLPTPAEIVEDPSAIHDLNQGMIYMTVSQLQEMGEVYRAAPRGEMIDTAKLHFSYMPPFVGTDEELEALVGYLAFVAQGDGAEPGANGGGQ
jgi:mono/diheme cytochrome c family protein